MPEGGEQPPWQPCDKVMYTRLPPENQRAERQRHLWRDAPPLTGLEEQEGSWKAMSTQCTHARIPGYTGFIPSARAEDICGSTHAAASRRAIHEQVRHRERRLEQQSREPWRPRSSGAMGRPLGGTSLPEDGRVNVVNNYWVPPIPGYSGFVPGKQSENLIGAGATATVRMAGRAIAERHSAERMRQASLAVEMNPEELAAMERARLAEQYRDHCEKQIPGYTGHIPRRHGEALYGATTSNVNRIAGSLCEDRLLNPEYMTSSPPQCPAPKQLRS